MEELTQVCSMVATVALTALAVLGVVYLTIAIIRKAKGV